MAVSVFTPNCTLPPPGTNLVTAPRVRSTFEIIWSCASIIILCTWSVLHLNVPRMRPAAGYWRSLWWTIVDCYHTKFKWMVVTILAPEITFGLAANSLIAAHSWGSINGDNKPIRNHLANMGYFVLDWGFDPAVHVGDAELSESEDRIRFCYYTLTVNIQRLSDGILNDTAVNDDVKLNASRLRGRYWTLTASQWSCVTDWGLAKLPDTPEHHLEKLGTSGGLLKGLALLQIAWLVVQLIVRKTRGLPSSQLEIATLAFAAESVLTYLCYWTKPQDVQTRSFIKVALEDGSRIATCAADDYKSFAETLVTEGPSHVFSFDWAAVRSGDFEDPSSMPDDTMHAKAVQLFFSSTTSIEDATIIAMAFGGVIFGSFHCLAWNFAFPTVVESIMWRASAIAVMAMLVMSIAFGVFIDLLPAPMHRICAIAILGTIVLYVLARLFLIAEMFRSLFYAVPGVFEDTWSSEVPHVG